MYKMINRVCVCKRRVTKCVRVEMPKVTEKN